MILLMDEALHNPRSLKSWELQLSGYSKWCKVSSINSIPNFSGPKGGDLGSGFKAQGVKCATAIVTASQTSPLFPRPHSLLKVSEG